MQQRADILKMVKRPSFASLMADAGLSSAELAKRIDVHPNTVSRWATGEIETPGPVRAYLKLYAAVRGLIA